MKIRGLGYGCCAETEVGPHPLDCCRFCGVDCSGETADHKPLCPEFVPGEREVPEYDAEDDHEDPGA